MEAPFNHDVKRNGSRFCATGRRVCQLLTDYSNLLNQGHKALYFSEDSQERWG
jgi:hypothetical protein